MPEPTQFRAFPVIEPDNPMRKIWDEIASYCSTQDLKQLSLASRFLTNVSQSHLFRELSFRHFHYQTRKDDDPFENENLHHQKQSLAAVRFGSIASSTRCCGIVQSWTYVDFCGNGIATPIVDRDRKLFGLFVEWLPAYPSLKSLVLSRIVLDSAILDVIAEIPSLESLKLLSVSLRPDSNLSSSTKYLRLKEFELLASSKASCSDVLPPILCVPECLESMMLVDPWDINPFLYDLTTNGICSNLRQLSISVRPETVPSFFKLLEGCDVLTELKVRHVKNEPILAPYPSCVLSPHRCPRLTDICAPVYFIWTLVPGRPVKKIEIDERRPTHDYRTLEEFRTAIFHATGSTATVEELQVSTCITPWSRTILQDIGQRLPYLKSLCFLIDDQSEFFEDVDEDEDLLLSSGAQYFVPTSYRALTKSASIDPTSLPCEYTRLMFDIASGSIPLSSLLSTLEIINFSAAPFNPQHGLAIVNQFSANLRFSNLRNLSLGNEADVHELTRTPSGWEAVAQGCTTHIF